MKLILSKECAERGCMAHDDRVDGPGVVIGQEPVAWELRKGKTDRVLLEITNDPRRAHDWKCSLEEVVPLYAAPQRVNMQLLQALEALAEHSARMGNVAFNLGQGHQQWERGIRPGIEEFDNKLREARAAIAAAKEIT